MKKIILLVALAASVIGVSSTFASPILGPGTTVATVQAHGTQVYYDDFRGGELGIVTLDGDGATDLDVYVYDQSGRLVAQGIGLTDYERVTFFVNQTQRYRIEVRNLGSTWNQFILMTD